MHFRVAKSFLLSKVAPFALSLWRMVQHIWWSFVLHFVLSLFSYQKKGVPCLQAADNQTTRRCHNPAELFTTSVFVFWSRRTPIDTDLIAGVCDWKTLQANISPLDPNLADSCSLLLTRVFYAKHQLEMILWFFQTLKITSIAKIRRYLAERLLNAKGRLTRYLASGLGC